MNIVFVTGALSGGGAERVISLMAAELSKRAHEIHVVSLMGDEADPDEWRGIAVHGVACKSRNHILNLVEKVRQLRKLLKAIQPDVAVSFMTGASITALLSCMFCSIPVVASERANPETTPEDFASRLLRKLTFWMAEGFVFQTRGAMECFSKSIRRRGIVIFNPINPALPIPFEGERKKRVVSAGRLVEAKNYSMAIEAFGAFHRQNPGYRYDIYGEGRLREPLTKLIHDLNLDGIVCLRGYTKDVYKEICDARMYVLSSDHEGMPNALMEAMALGLPVISTDHPLGGAAVLIEDGSNGFLVPVRDAAAMADTMCVLAKDAALADRIGLNGAKIRDTFSVDTIASQWEAYLTKVLGRTPKSAQPE